jgi:hypothetical protein
MRPIRRAAVTGLMALWLAPLPALAGSQSSNSSSDCDGPRCRRVDSYVVEDRLGRRGWVREQHWFEGVPRGADRDRRERPPRPWRDQLEDDDDDDDD